MAKKIIDAQAVSASFASDAVSFPTDENVAIQILVKGTNDLTGTFNIQVALDRGDSGVYFESVPFIISGVEETDIAASDDDNFSFLGELLSSASWLRINYTHSSGSGDVTVWMSEKE